MISTEQIRAARALLRWTAQNLADVSGVGVATIRRIELMDGVPSGQVRTQMATARIRCSNGDIYNESITCDIYNESIS